MEQEKHKGMQSSFDKFVQTSSECSFCIVSLFAYAKVEDEVFYRQNVIFELGYFVNKLGKNNVLIITNETEDDLPSDIKGTMVLKIDNEGKWKKQLLDLLDSSGF